MDRTIFDEVKDIQRLIGEKRELAFMLKDTLKTAADNESRARLEGLIHDHEITVKALELYLDVLEKTVQAHSRNLDAFDS